MTPEETFEILSNELRIITDIISYCRNFENCNDMALAYRIKRKDAIKMAIEVLEKQIPKAPIMKPYYEDMPDEEYLCCPTCGDILTDRIPDDNKNFYFHCLNCGQKFDWGGENA